MKKDTGEIYTLYERVDPPEFYEISSLTYEELFEESQKESDVLMVPQGDVRKSLDVKPFGSSEQCANIGWHQFDVAFTCVLDDFMMLNFNQNTLGNMFVLIYIPTVLFIIGKIPGKFAALVSSGKLELNSMLLGLGIFGWIFQLTTSEGRTAVL